MLAHIAVHSSQSPESVREDLLRSLRERSINQKFHYESYKQSRKYLAVHQAYSPSRIDDNCKMIFRSGFEAAVAALEAPEARVVGLGAGGGQKDTQLLELLRQQGVQAGYSPIDVSLPLLLTARETALTQIAAKRCEPLLCDIATASDLPAALDRCSNPDVPRIITFFTMIPNFEPSVILPKFSALVRMGDFLLLSANLSPGADYAEGVRRILPGYNNPLTRAWLETFLFDLGVEQGDGDVEFRIEPGECDLLRIVARFRFTRPRALNVEGEEFSFNPEDTIRLFFSYRHTPERIHDLLAAYGLVVQGEWITENREEGVFLCRRGKR